MCFDYRKQHEPTLHYVWPWTLEQVVDQTTAKWRRRRGRAWMQQIEDDIGLNDNDAWTIVDDRKL